MVQKGMYTVHSYKLTCLQACDKYMIPHNLHNNVHRKCEEYDTKTRLTGWYYRMKRKEYGSHEVISLLFSSMLKFQRDIVSFKCVKKKCQAIEWFKQHLKFPTEINKQTLPLY